MKFEELKILSKEEEIELFRRYHMGDEGAFDRIVEGFQMEVHIIADKFAQKNLRIPLNDLVQEGNIALMNSIKAFKPELGYRFYTVMRTSVYNILLLYVTKDRTIPINLMKFSEFQHMKSVDIDEENDVEKYLRNEISDYHKEEVKEYVSELLDSLNERERFIIESYYGIGKFKMEIREIAKQVGYTREHCSVVHLRIIKRLKEKKV